MAKVEKKNGGTLSAWQGHPNYRWRVTYPDGSKRRTKGFKTSAGVDVASVFADKTPFSPPCISPKFVLHGLSARSKFLAVVLRNLFFGDPEEDPA